MGRPLFSHAYTAPAVRVEPEPYEKWSYWNPFDPDSEEFFADAEEERIRSPEPESETPVLEGVVRGVTELVEEAASSGSSEASSSGRGTPTLEDDGLSVEELELYRRRVIAGNRRDTSASPTDDGQTYRAVARPRTSFVRSSWYIEDGSRSPSPVQFSVPRAQVVPEPVVAADAPSAATVTRTSPIPIPAPARPTTPQNNTASYSYGSPSPPPSVTPRLYTWARTTVAAPSPSSPLPNRSARRSLAHITASPSARIVF